MMRETKTCPMCGVVFTPRNRGQICCSKSCGKTRENKRRSAQKHTMICHFCGKPFEAADRAVYCSKDCRVAAAKAPLRDKNREFTPDTPYLCQKWRREGMSVKKIAEILLRSTESVRKALAVPLTAEQYRDMEEYRR